MCYTSSASVLNDLVKVHSSKGGGLLTLSPGVYFVDPPLILPHNVSLIGSGCVGPFEEKGVSGGTVLVPVKKANGPVIYLPSGYSGLIENLTIDGRWQVDVGIFVDGAQGAELRRLTVVGVNIQGMVVKDSVFCKFENVYVKYSWIGVELIGSPSQPTTLNLFSHCMFEGRYESIRLVRWVDNNWFEYTRVIAPVGGFGLAVENGEEIYANVFLSLVFEGRGTGVIDARSRYSRVYFADSLVGCFFTSTLSRVLYRVDSTNFIVVR